MQKRALKTMQIEKDFFYKITVETKRKCAPFFSHPLTQKTAFCPQLHQ
jgi:hypothetical protein